MRKKRKPRAVATHGAIGGVQTRTRPYSTRRTVPQIGFAHWCAIGAPWGQTDLDPEIVSWIIRIMSEREAAGINTITHLMRWVELHKPRFSWKTKLEWERVVLSARAMSLTYLRVYEQHEEEGGVL